MGDVSESNRPLKVFISYAHEDENYLNKLKKHMSVLERRGLLESWHDRELTPGQVWRSEILEI